MGINNSDNSFYVSPLATAMSVASALLAALSYFIVPEKFRNSTIYAAYWVLLLAIGALTITTGATNSPFIALWMIAAIFAGIFGPATLVILFVVVSAALGFAIINDRATNEIILDSMLIGELPILVSYILWHGKSNSESSKERAYYDLANELSQVANKSEVVINAISDGVIAVSNQGLIELINPAAQRIVGWGHQDALNLDYKSVLQLLSKDNHELDKTTDPIFNVLSTNQLNHRSDLQLQTNSGKKINIDVVVSPIGRLGSGAIIVFRDVTKEQAEGRAQAEFISTASHEMRTPVASIEGYLGLAMNPATATIDAKARDFISKAHEAAQHLGRLFQDLLDVTKADDGRLSNNPKVIEVVEFTNTIIEGLQSKATEKNLRIFFNPGPDKNDRGIRNITPVYYVDLDADHLREVLSNLVENAIKYTPKGEVVIDVKGDDGHVVISIADSGIGIPVEDIPHLFQKFYRVDNSDTREIGGTGLGLYLCRRLVEAMGGRIWVESEYKKGSTFSVELPRISHDEASRLIESSNRDSIKPAVSNPYLDENGPDTPTVEERARAITTPIITKVTAPIRVAQPAVATPVSTTSATDPLLGAGPVASPTPDPLRSRNPTVLTPDMLAAADHAQVVTAAQPSPTPVAQPSTTTTVQSTASVAPSSLVIPGPVLQPTTTTAPSPKTVIQNPIMPPSASPERPLTIPKR